MMRALTTESLSYLAGKLPYEFGNVTGSITKSIPYLSIFPENSNHDSHRRGKAEDSGSTAGQPWGAPGQRRAVPPDPLLHQRALGTAPPLGIQNGLWNYRKGKRLGSEAASIMSPGLRKSIFFSGEGNGVLFLDRVWRVSWWWWGCIYIECWADYQWGVILKCLPDTSLWYLTG